VEIINATECNTYSSEKENISEHLNNSRDVEDQSPDHNEFSEGNDDLQHQYKATNFAENSMYQDEVGYSYYYEDVNYDEDGEHNSDEGDDELEEYSQLVTDQHDYYANYTRNPDEDMYNSAEGITENIEPNNQNSSGEEENSVSDDGRYSKEEANEELNLQSSQEIQETVVDYSGIPTASNINPDNVELNGTSSFGTQDVKNVVQEKKHGIYNNDSNLNLVNSNDEINNLQSSHQHRKTVELIEHQGCSDDFRYEEKPVASFLGTKNTKNRRRKKLRKT